MMKRTNRKRYLKGMADATPEERSCTRKIAHPTELVARLEAQKHMILSRGATQVMWVYPCTFCAAWHLTTRPSDARGRVTVESIAPNGRYS